MRPKDIMNHLTIHLACALIALACGAVGNVCAAADDGRATFDQLFGEQVKAVADTRSPDDDLALAKQLLKTAGTLKATEPVVPYLYEQAFELARTAPEGMDTVRQAIDALAELSPKRAEALKQRMVELIERAYRTARGEARQQYGEQLLDLLHTRGQSELDAGEHRDAIKTYRQAVLVARSIRSDRAESLAAYQSLATARASAVNRIAVLERSLDNPPIDEKVSTELVRLCVVTLDSVEKARSYALLLDKDTQSRLAAASKPIDEVDPATCAELGQWIAGLSAREKGLIQLKALRKAEAYLARAVESAADSDQPRSVSQLKAELALKKVRDTLSKLGQTADTAAGWTDLSRPLATMVAAGKLEGEGGKASIEKGVFVFERQDGYKGIKLPLEPKDVIFSVEVKRVSGQEMHMSARNNEKGWYSARIEAGNQIVLIHGNSVRRKELARATSPAVKEGQWFEIAMVAVEDVIQVHVNGKKLMEARNSDLPGPGNIGFSVLAAKAEFRKPKFREPTAAQKRMILKSGKK